MIALCLLAGGAIAAGTVPPTADMQRALENLDRQEAALTAWLADVEDIVRLGVNNAGDPQQALYTPAYIEAMQRSLEALRAKRLALSKTLETAAEPAAPARATK